MKRHLSGLTILVLLFMIALTGLAESTYYDPSYYDSLYYDSSYYDSSYYDTSYYDTSYYDTSYYDSSYSSSKNLQVENGMMQPILLVSDPRDAAYSNEKSDVLRFCVYVETDHDTDGDGKADLVKALVQVPRAAVEGYFKAAVIYDPTPYSAGTVEEYAEDVGGLYDEVPFDYAKLYNPGEKRIPAGTVDTLTAAMYANPDKDWNYTVPYSGDTGYGFISYYDYYLMRGFAVVEACGIGTYGSEGFELCGTDLERDSHKCVIEWLTGKRVAYTDRKNNIAIKADWCNGNIAMTGVSYGGTLPYEVATTGVEGLKTIIPFAGIASWYDYTNSQGVPTLFDVNYADTLAAYNCGGTFLDNDWTVPNEDYGAWLWQISKDQDATNGDYADIWNELDYSHKTDNIRCSALIVHGINDFNVTTKQADLMMQAFAEAGQTAKLVLHQDGHNDLYGKRVGDMVWEDLMNLWLSHYLYDVDNGIENQLPAVLAQSNVDGQFKAYASWRDFNYQRYDISSDEASSDVSTVGLAAYSVQFLEGETPELKGQKGKELYYVTLPEPFGEAYDVDVPAGTTIYGVPEVHVNLSTEVTDKDGLMITAVLIDVAEDSQPFKAYMTKDRLSNTLPVKTVDIFDLGFGYERDILEYVKSSTYSKCISFGWTDLCNPGLGYDSSEYTKSEELVSGQLYNYTFYMLPTVYTLEPGHRLLLVLTSWDPYRAFLDEDYNVDPSLSTEFSEFNYSFTIDNTSLYVNLPLAQDTNNGEG